jgi:hypothetical protein
MADDDERLDLPERTKPDDVRALIAAVLLRQSVD